MWLLRLLGVLVLIAMVGGVIATLPFTRNTAYLRFPGVFPLRPDRRPAVGLCPVDSRARRRHPL